MLGGWVASAGHRVLRDRLGGLLVEPVSGIAANSVLDSHDHLTQSSPLDQAAPAPNTAEGTTLAIATYCCGAGPRTNQPVARRRTPT